MHIYEKGASKESQLPKAGNKGKQAPKSQPNPVAKPATKSTQSKAKANVQPSITKFATRPVQNKPTTKTAPQPVPKQVTTRPTQDQPAQRFYHHTRIQYQPQETSNFILTKSNCG
ncbi:uncharacterized protein LOC143192706 [Rhynchophorus ferrugineus]|uniref:uncharacterized protein LOC143192706 n=1 Tax=Rhynchophorus ferrugineus TaxID=354439 RepID=UPI003FCCB8ED